MNKLISAFFGLLLCLPALGQDSSQLHPIQKAWWAHPFSSAKPNHHFSVEGISILDAQMLNNKLFKGLLIDKSIDQNTIDKALEKMSDYNQLELQQQLEVSYARKLRKNQIDTGVRHYIGLSGGYKDLGFANLTGDAISLVFKGNAPFAGQELIFDNITFNRNQFYYLNLDWYGQNDTKRHPLKWRVSLGGIHAYRMFDLQTERARLRTSELGDTLGADLTYNFTRALEGGFGAQLNFDFNVSLAPDKAVTIRVQDLGYIQYRNTRSFASDTSYDFTGYPLQTNGGNFFDNFNADTLNRLVYKQIDSGNVGHWLPFLFQLQFNYKPNNKHWVNVAISHRNYRSYKTRLLLNHMWWLGPKFVLNTEISGNRTRFVSWSQGFTWMPIKNCYIHAKWHHVVQTIAVEQMAGMGAQFGVSAVF